MGLHTQKRLTTGAKRKSKKQLMKQIRKKIRIGSQRDNILDNQIVFTETNLARDDSFDSDISDEVFIEKENLNNIANFSPAGRRIVDINHLFTVLKEIRHDMFGCTFHNVEIIAEKHFGFKSVFTYKCNMCGITDTFSTENENKKCGINEAAVCGTVAIGAGHSQLTEFSAALDIPQMSSATYVRIEKKVLKNTEELALKEMLAAGKEERKFAIEAGEIDSDGIPFITVTVDGAWSKRSYKSNYNALSGVGCIIGTRTKKVLYVGVKNKMCKFCKNNDKKNVPSHKCFQNWNSSSTSMEAAIILDGFRMSIEMHNLRYKTIIGDGDSSVYKKIQTAKPYGPTYFIQKIECRNHVLRNFCTKIREISKTPRSDMSIRNFLRQNILKFRTAVVSAIKYRKNENVSLQQKIEYLKNDILNGPAHIFGEHSNCASYFCSKDGNNLNTIDYKHFKSSALYDIFFQSLNRVANLSSSLLYDVDNNAVESFNSVVNKFVGGKRINFSLGSSYQGRCFAAAINYNNKETFVYTFVKESNGDNFTGVYLEKFKNLKLNQAIKKKSKKNKIRIQSADSDYGACKIVVPDMPFPEYESKRKQFLDELSLSDCHNIQIRTVNQRHNNEWEKERQIRLTASNFGKICKMREKTDTASTIKHMLYTNRFNNKKLPNSLQYGIDNEERAKQKFMEITNLKVEACGLFIDEKKKFLGATPDGLIGFDSIIEIKCPYSARDKLIHEAINEKLINYCTLDANDSNKILLKPFDNYMYQVQGQLHITKREKCYFVVYTKHDLKYIVIERNDDFWNHHMIEHLEKFYMNAMLPEIIDSRYNRDQSIRSIMKKDL